MNAKASSLVVSDAPLEGAAQSRLMVASNRAVPPAGTLTFSFTTVLNPPPLIVTLR